MMDEIREKLKTFNSERDWEQFHTPENLAKSISIEAGELLECFQWNNEYSYREVCDEIADVMMYCIMFVDKVGIELEREILRKLEENGEKYPITKCRGNSKKYTQLGE